MQNDNKLSWKIKTQITKFASKITEGMDKVQCRFVSEMIYGIQGAKDVKISNIARVLNEPIKLIKTENRLCRNLEEEDLTERINKYLCWEGAGAVNDETVLAVDLGDIRKNYAKKMDNLSRVRDGSTGEIVDGYNLCSIIGAHPYGDKIVPLYGELYSTVAEDFISENAQILKAIKFVSASTVGKGIFVIDRGGDRREILYPLIDAELQFVVRQDGDRHIVMPGGKKCSVEYASRWCKCEVEREVEVEREGYREVKHLKLGFLPVRISEREKKQLYLVVIRGFSETPIMLLTNVEPTNEKEFCVWIADIYLTRWKCEEAYRFVKQSYNLEDVRVRGYDGLRNIYILVHAVFYFVSVVIGTKAKLNLIFKKICEKAKRFYEIANFFQYAVADGIHKVLFGARSRFRTGGKEMESTQSEFVFTRPHF